MNDVITSELREKYKDKRVTFLGVAIENFTKEDLIIMVAITLDEKEKLLEQASRDREFIKTIRGINREYRT